MYDPEANPLSEIQIPEQAPLTQPLMVYVLPILFEIEDPNDEPPMAA